jgi:hypothetical protein
MLKKVLFAATVCGLVVGIALPLQPSPARAKAPALAGLTCKEAAKLKFPSDVKARHSYKHECKTAWKASHKKAA